ncbi:hypothetical protein BBFGKLBO_02387 [Synechococcus sp. CBW1107]|uniref:hypothetical protein n=1 Tax=Synechococcus sp. CBW1107 TaxID=2789857 RepID=UPI002AD290A5|nr:hypothetical protein [Synechococcus sp. CBW1107]CAK6698103.1 hypothetical protein BBFGKLBO_02387 [Synechococcus sp. CBW1107]
MIHLTVAVPLGIDSIFFSFVQRLAELNNHPCIDPPAQQLDKADPGGWITKLKDSSQHHFVIGYRYPPTYWKQLAESADTVILLVDSNGIARQIDQFRFQNINEGGPGDLIEAVNGIREALEATISLTEWIQAEESTRSKLLPPASAFLQIPSDAFRRLEEFYRQAGVNVQTSCFDGFAAEATPLLQQQVPVPKQALMDIQRLLALEHVTPTRLKAVSILFAINT